LTRINLSFLENLRSIWVAVIGLELLSLACPGLGLGSDYVTSFTYVTLSMLWLFDHISVENRIWGDWNGTEFGVMLIVQGFVRCDARTL
jgi:hypothetical protein